MKKIPLEKGELGINFSVSLAIEFSMLELEDRKPIKKGVIGLSLWSIIKGVLASIPTNDRNKMVMRNNTGSLADYVMEDIKQIASITSNLKDKGYNIIIFESVNNRPFLNKDSNKRTLNTLKNNFIFNVIKSFKASKLHDVINSLDYIITSNTYDLELAYDKRVKVIQTHTGKVLEYRDISTKVRKVKNFEVSTLPFSRPLLEAIGDINGFYNPYLSTKEKGELLSLLYKKRVNHKTPKTVLENIIKEVKNG